MTAYRTISGLTFQALSPSLYELCARDDESLISTVSLAYIPHAWYIDILMKSGPSHHRGPFASKEAAAAVLAGRRTDVA